MSWKDTILDKYWNHLWTEHSGDKNFDIILEHKLMTDWVIHGWEVSDRSIMTVACDHIDCNWKRSYHVMYYVTPMEEE
tara:strand:- start:444 stop:677 length:234 start_codon:yes stop_codon:yes gene_type:complete